MAATFLERCLSEGDFAEDGGNIGNDILRTMFRLYDEGLMTAAFIKTTLELTTPQGNELDEILATRPGVLESLLTRSSWVSRVLEIIRAGEYNWPGYETAADVRERLGLD